MVYLAEDTGRIEPLYDGWEESCIWSCLQGVMGKIYVEDRKAPASAMAVLGDFCFFGGKPSKELVLYSAGWRNPEFVIMVPQNEAWGNLIRECWGENAREVTRYAIKKEPGIFDEEKLREAVAALPGEYTIKLIDEEIYDWCKEHSWSRDWVSNYADYEEYSRKGLGVVIQKNGEPVSGVSSYSSYIGGIEIEIGTKEGYRRKGLAYICGARIILECMERGLYPSWDAQNKWSVGLAEKLGYHYSHDYAAFEVRRKTF